MARRQAQVIGEKVFFCKMDARDKAIKPSKYDFSTVFLLKENRQNLIHGMCHVLVVLHELTPQSVTPNPYYATIFLTLNSSQDLLIRDVFGLKSFGQNLKKGIHI